MYLEQAYPRPKWLFPTAFAFQSVILSFSAGNAIVLAQYLYATSGHDPTPWGLKGVAMAGYTVAFFREYLIVPPMFACSLEFVSRLIVS